MTLPLDGIRVLDLGHFIAGPMAALLLADQGAEVIRVEPPRPNEVGELAPQMFRRNHLRTEKLDLKTSNGTARMLELVSETDILIENFRPGAMDRLGLGPDKLCTQFAQLIYCSLPGFSRRDPRADAPGWEGLILAAAGAYSTGSQEMVAGEWWPSSDHAFTPLLLASHFAGMQAAMAAAAALIARERDGQGQFIEVPLFDSFFEATGARALRYERNAPSGLLFGSGLYLCSDDRYVNMVTVWRRHLEWFLEASDCQAWQTEGLAEPELLSRNPKLRRELNQRLVKLFRTRPAQEWEELGRRAGVPIAALRSTDEWCAEPAARESGAIIEVAAAGEIDRVPGMAVDVTMHARDLDGSTPTSENQSSARALGNLRVLDFTRVLAAPMATRLMSEFGADVVRVDTRAEINSAGVRQPLFHESANRGKRTLWLDLKTTGGRAELESLLSWADVIVTNFTHPALDRLGIDEASVRTIAPDIVHVHLSTFGSTGEWRDHRGYAEIANAVTGITWRTLGNGPPSGAAPNADIPRVPFTDYAAGILAAFGAHVGVFARARGGGGSSVATSLVGAATLLQLPLIASKHGGKAQTSETLTSGWSATQHIYAFADRLGFLALAPDVRHAALADWGIDVEARETTIVDELQEIFARKPLESVARDVQCYGGAVHELTDLETLLQIDEIPDQLGLLVTSRSEEFGIVKQFGPTIHLSRTPMKFGGLPDDSQADWPPRCSQRHAATST